MAERRILEVPRTARIYVQGDVLGDPGSALREVWCLLHGYGQLAEPFLRAAGVLERPGRTLVAPEGLSRFYLKRGTGVVGASWMTREERAEEIRDVLRYLDRVWEEVSGRTPAASLTALGFSQGGAAAARWAVLGRAPVAHLVSWGCPLPPDLDLEAHRERARALRWTFVLGDRDTSIDRTAHAAGIERLRASGIEPDVRRFPGGHELEPALLAELGA